jgi:hypothetical protein
MQPAYPLSTWQDNQDITQRKRDMNEKAFCPMDHKLVPFDRAVRRS